MNRLREGIVGTIGRRFFYGWTLVGVAGLGIFTSGPGQSHTFSVFLDAIARDLDISSATIAAAYAAATLIAALLLPCMGRLFDRYGARRVLFFVTLSLGGACILFGAAANILWLAVGFALLRFFGQGSLMLGGANLMAHWFNDKRGLAISLMSLGFGVSMAVHPPLASYLIETVGWREAWLWLGLSTWIVMLPAVILLVVNYPEDLDTVPDGQSLPLAELPASDATVTINGLTRAQALHEPAFYILSAGCFSMSMLITTLHFHQIAVLSHHGIDSEFGARIFIVSAVSMVIFMPVVGALLDRFRTRYVFALGLLVTAGCLIGITLVYDGVSAIFYAVIFGINNTFGMTMIGFVWPRYFGRRHIGVIQGTGQLIGVIGASLGALPVGLAFTFIGSPDSTLHLLALLPLFCATLALFLRTPKGFGIDARLD